MATEHPEGFDPNAEQEVIDYGPEYDKLMKDREYMNKVKKDVNKVCPQMKKISELITEIAKTDDASNKENWGKKLDVARKNLKDIRNLVEE